MTWTRWDEWNERMDMAREFATATMHERSLRQLAQERAEVEDSLTRHNFALWESEQDAWWDRGAPDPGREEDWR